VHLCENVIEVFRRLVLDSYFKHHWGEEVAAGLSDVDLDASNDADFHIWNRLDDAFDILMRNLVHGVSKLCHRLLCRFYLLEVGFKSLAYISKLVVESVGAGRNDDTRVLVVYGLPFVLF